MPQAGAGEPCGHKSYVLKRLRSAIVALLVDGCSMIPPDVLQVHELLAVLQSRMVEVLCGDSPAVARCDAVPGEAACSQGVDATASVHQDGRQGDHDVR